MEIYSNDGQILVVPDWTTQTKPSIEDLCFAISSAHDAAQGGAVKAINRLQTMRNWLIGYYIVEYEQKGTERAEYGTRLLKEIVARVNKKGINETLLQLSRSFYQNYPQMVQNFNHEKSATLSHKFIAPICATPLHKLDDQTNNPASKDKLFTSGKDILSHLSFSHIRELLTINDCLERYFYEQECMRCNWSVRELRRQIDSNLYIRIGLSKNKDKLITLSQGTNTASLSIKEPYTFEFLGLQAKEVVTEDDLESALIDHLQEFMLELGRGFCFEARQPRIIIDDEYYYPDLVFYNRILHCHVIIELKDEAFSHQNIGQLNAYVSYYKENEKCEGDNDPVGILLCTKKGKKMVEYALAGLDNNIFVSTYMLQLPNKEQLEQFLKEQINKFN